MPKYLTEWDNLTTVGKKGHGMDYKRDILNAVTTRAFKYASLSSLILSILFFYLGTVV